jgi:S1-C subfamily serine protease
MKNIIKTVGIALTLVLLTLVARNLEHRYDFKETITKVSGRFGHGSGNIIESGKDYSLILTNKHVCEGTNVTPAITQALNFIKLVKGMYPKCKTFECMSKSDTRFGPAWFGVLLNLAIQNIEIEVTSSIQDFVKKLTKLKNTDADRPLFIKFNNLDIKTAIGKIHAVSEFQDLCLVKIPVGNLPVVLISDKKPKVGDRVVTIGNPHSVENHMVEGFAGDEKRLYGNMYQLISAPIYPGQSGSATFNSDGHLVGVNTLTDTRAATIGYMIVLEDIKMFLQGNLINRKVGMKI